jgi:phosphate-selective porin OprO/OprP
MLSAYAAVAQESTTAEDEESTQAEQAADVPHPEEEVVAPPEESPEDDLYSQPIGLKWKAFTQAVRGLTRYSLFDDKVRFRLGGFIQADGTGGWESERFTEDIGTINSDLDLRRLRLFARGHLNRMHFELSFDFGVDAGIKDAWVENPNEGLRIWGRDLGLLRMGLMKEPFSLARQMSGNHLAFLEWGLPVSTFAPGRNVGIMVHDQGEKGRMSWALGVFSFGNRTEDNASSSVFSITTRWTALPIYRDQGKKLLHLGASFSSRNPRENDVRHLARPEARAAPFLADTGDLDARGEDLFGLELAVVMGSLWIQTEWIRTQVDSVTIGDPAFWGSYLELGYFLTGNVKPYRSSNGTFGRVRPAVNYRRGNPFRKTSGGVWELVARASTVDLNDRDITGGKLDNLSAGISWYLNSTSRVMLNYINSKVKDSGTAHIVLLRYQYQPF